MIQTSRESKVGFWSQVAITFFIVSGGAFGLESAVGAVGPGWTLLLVLVIPFVWVLPTILMISELSSMMPQRGGYYVWVREGLGRFWGFQEGWWTLCYSAVDLAIYPVLFVTYLSYFFPILAAESPTPSLRWGICVLFIGFGFLLNLRGSRVVGFHKFIEFCLVSLPFFGFVIWGITKGDWQQALGAVTAVGGEGAAMGASQIATGLAVLIWNFTGWDNATTYADEITEPHRTIPRSLLMALVLVCLSYVLPLLIGYKLSVDPKLWAETSGWPEIFSLLGGRTWGISCALVALISAWALFNSQLLYIARLPAAMASDGLLPKVLQTENKNRVPVLSLMLAALVAVMFCGFSLGKIMLVDILLYSLGLGLEFVALIRLRKIKPHHSRSFRVPLPTWGLICMSFLPGSVATAIAYFSILSGDSSQNQLLIVGGLVLVGGLIFWLRPPRQRSEA